MKNNEQFQRKPLNSVSLFSSAGERGFRRAHDFSGNPPVQSPAAAPRPPRFPIPANCYIVANALPRAATTALRPASLAR